MKGESVVEVTGSIKEAEKVLQGITRELKTWDAENPKPTGFMREEAIDAHFMDWLRNSAASHDDKDLGAIVRQVVNGLEDL